MPGTPPGTPATFGFTGSGGGKEIYFFSEAQAFNYILLLVSWLYVKKST